MKNRPTLILGTLLFTVAGLGLGYAFGRLLKSSGAAPHLSPWVLLALPFVVWFVIALHELGHVLGGWNSGFQLAFFAVGPLKIYRDYNHLRVAFNRSPTLWGGVAATAPRGSQPPSTPFMRQAMLRVVAGGPLLSLAGTFLLIPATLLLSASPSLAVVIGAAGLMSFFIALATSIPVSTSGFLSDGARLLQLLRGGQAAERWAYLVVLSGLSLTVRPREWPADIVLACARQGDTTYDGISAAWLRSTWHEDRGEFEEARQWLEQALAAIDHWPKPARPLLHASAACLYATLGDAARARPHLEAARQPGFLDKDHLHLAEATVLESEGRRAEAQASARKGLALIPAEATGFALLHREKLSKIAL
jgi:hypothetical protein